MPKRSIKNLFPCENCLIATSHKYRGRSLNLNGLGNRVSVFDGIELIAREPVEKMVPACRFCRGFYLHEIVREVE